MGRFQAAPLTLGAERRSKVARKRPWPELYVLSPRSRQDGAGFFLQDLTPARTELAGPTVDRCEGSKASKDEGDKAQVGMQQGCCLVSTVAAKARKPPCSASQYIDAVPECVVIVDLVALSRSTTSGKELISWQTPGWAVEKRKMKRRRGFC